MEKRVAGLTVVCPIWFYKGKSYIATPPFIANTKWMASIKQKFGAKKASIFRNGICCVMAEKQMEANLPALQAAQVWCIPTIMSTDISLFCTGCKHIPCNLRVNLESTIINSSQYDKIYNCSHQLPKKIDITPAFCKLHVETKKTYFWVFSHKTKQFDTEWNLSCKSTCVSDCQLYKRLRWKELANSPEQLQCPRKW